jgi:hypothetical protein
MGLILTIGDDDVEFFRKEYVNLPELHSAIEKALSEEEMTDGEVEPHEQWRERTNYLIDMYNSRSHYKKFDRV